MWLLQFLAAIGGLVKYEDPEFGYPLVCRRNPKQILPVGQLTVQFPKRGQFEREAGSLRLQGVNCAGLKSVADKFYDGIIFVDGKSRGRKGFQFVRKRTKVVLKMQRD